ncbi:MAG: hypothetical protein WCC87_00640 [Candidatus Korobacteraceae bacterium]
MPGPNANPPNHLAPRSNRNWLIFAVAVVVFAYSLPFLLNHFLPGPFLNVAVVDEKIYLARIMDAYRGGSLGNPYLAEHQDAPRFMPELAERLVALTAHGTGLPPLLVLSVSRVLLPGLICVVLWSLARALGMEPRLAALAALLPPLAPTISWIASTDSRTIGFLRYLRAVSPAFYVLLMLLALRLVLLAWKKPLWWTGLLAGATLGFLIYASPIYFWSFAIAGAAWLAMQDSGKVRAALLISVVTALLVGLPHFRQASLQGRLPEVRETLARLDLLTPGRDPDEGVTRTLVMAVAVAAAVWLGRRRLGERARFLFPFLCVGTLLMVQNLVTNRHLQGNHWIECLIPVWSLAGVAFLQSSTQSFRPIYVWVLLGVLSAGAIFTQAMGYLQWEQLRQENAEFWALDGRMPRTLQWLNKHTPASSVVVADTDVMDSLPLFTHNKVYWADYASQHVMPEWEVQSRTQSLESWRPDGAAQLPFHADFYLGTGLVCLRLKANQFLYRDLPEGTCVMSL